MSILLLGGTGVIGSYLVTMFNDKNIDTVVTSRRKQKNFGSITYVEGNAMDDDFLNSICKEQRWDAIVDFMSYKTDKFAMRLDTLLNSTKQYLYISSARVYGNEEKPIKENSPRLLDCSKDKSFLLTDEYALTKARQEDLLINSGRTNYTIIRPCITYGDERMQLGVMEKEEWLYRALRGKTIVFCQEIADRITTMTTGIDMSTLIFNVIANPKAVGEIYHFTSNHHRTWKELYSIYEKALTEITQKKPRIKMVSLNDFLSCRNKNLRYQVIYDRVYDRVYNTEKQSELAPIEQFISPEDGLKQSISNFIKQGAKFKNINWEHEGRKDRLTKERTPLTQISGLKNRVKYIIARYL